MLPETLLYIIYGLSALLFMSILFRLLQSEKKEPPFIAPEQEGLPEPKDKPLQAYEPAAKTIMREKSIIDNGLVSYRLVYDPEYNKLVIREYGASSTVASVSEKKD